MSQIPKWPKDRALKKKSHTTAKEPLRVQDRKIVQHEKFRAMDSDFTLQPAFKKLLLVEFLCSIKKELSTGIWKGY